MNLDILIENFNVAVLTYDPLNDNYAIQYTNEWKKKGFELSPHIPLDDQVNSNLIKAFLANLLPEGEALREISAFYQLSLVNTIGFIDKLGKDLPGALRLLPHNTNHVVEETKLRKIQIDELTQRIINRDRESIIFWDGAPRLSLAGVQDKLQVFYHNGEFGFGEGDLASTHILKFEKKGDHNLVLNEFMSLQLAKKLKLSVAEHELMFFSDEPALLIKRFDRDFNDGRVKRRHVIDGCQALNIFPQFKYQRMYGSGKDVRNVLGAANFKNLFAFADKSQIPLAAKLSLIDMTIFNIAISNSDAHAKNISYFAGRDGYQMTPLYDLVNISLYPSYEQDLAMSIGEEFTIGNLTGYDFALFCEECNIKSSFFVKRLLALKDKFMPAVESLIKTSILSNSPFVLEYAKKIEENINLLQKISPEIESAYKDYIEGGNYIATNNNLKIETKKQEQSFNHS